MSDDEDQENLRDRDGEGAHKRDKENRNDRVGRRFAEYHRKHPWVQERLVAMARRYKAANRRRGIRFFLEILRHEEFMAPTTDPQGFKLNNDWCSRYSRQIEKDHPDMDGFFLKRRLRAVGFEGGTAS